MKTLFFIVVTILLTPSIIIGVGKSSEKGKYND